MSASISAFSSYCVFLILFIYDTPELIFAVYGAQILLQNSTNSWRLKIH